MSPFWQFCCLTISYFQASKAGMRGLFRAFLSSSERSLENIVRWRQTELGRTRTFLYFVIVLFRYTNRDLPVVNLRGEVLFQAWRDIFHDNRFVQLSAIQNTKSFKHLESLSFPKRESSTASVGRMFSTVLTGECLVNTVNYTKGWKVSFNSSEHMDGYRVG